MESKLETVVEDLREQGRLDKSFRGPLGTGVPVSRDSRHILQHPAGGARARPLRVFNSPGYLELEAARLGGTPIRIERGDGPVIALVARQVPGSTLRDGVSVYGYPDLDQRYPVPENLDTDHVLEALRGEGAGHGLVSVFFRLGLDQDAQGPADPSLARKAHIGDVVVVNLQRDWEQIFSGFQPRLRTDLRNKGDGIEVKLSDDITVFHSIYTECMTRVGAQKGYFFSLDYMSRLFSMPGVDLFLATDSTGPLAGALTVAQGNLLFYHLGATGDRGLARSALRFVLSGVMRHHAGGAFRRLVLGGGLGGANDSLLRFKRNFSREMLPVSALKVVLDREAYAALSGPGQGRDPFSGFFPAYRDPTRN